MIRILVAASLSSTTLSHGTVGESGSFALDTRDAVGVALADSATFVLNTWDDVTTLTEESPEFSLDTRAIDGLAGNRNSGTFVLDTRYGIPDGLAIEGPHSVTPGTHSFTASVPDGQGGMLDVSSACEWSIQGTVPDGVLIGHGKLQLGGGTAPGPLTILAAYLSPSGRQIAEKVVTVGNSLSVQIGHSITSTGGNSYQVALTGSVTGAVGTPSVQWTSTHTGTFSSAHSLATNWFVSTDGGPHSIILTVLDSTGVPISKNKTIYIDKPPVPNQPGKLAPASDGAQGSFLSSNGESYQFDPARVGRGLIVLTHGLNGSGRNDWIKNLAKMIEEEVPEDARPNILIFDWEHDANPNHFSVPAEVEDGVAIAKGFGWLSKIGGRRLITSLKAADFLTDLATIKPMAIRQGVILCNWLTQEANASPPRVDFSKPVHFIGHSAGGFVLGEAALQLKEKGLLVDRVTMLDTPVPHAKHLTDLPNPTVVDRYASTVFGLLVPPGAWGLEDNEFQSLVAAFGDGLWPLLKGAALHLAHGDAHEWYRKTVIPDSGFEYAGFYFSPFKDGPTIPSKTLPAPEEANEFATSDTPYRRPQTTSLTTIPLTGFQVFGNATESGGVWTIVEDRDAGIFVSIAIPPDATRLKFRYRWSGVGDGDFLGVRLGRRSEMMVGPDLEISRSDYLNSSIELGRYAGLTDDLTFTLVSRGEPDAVLSIKEITIERDDDADGDGLSTNEELALGTSCQNRDTDDDTLSDLDEVNVYFTNPTTSDTDGDGFSDDAELIAGTDPNDGAAYLRVSNVTMNIGGTVTLKWASEGARIYNVQRSPDLTFTSYEIIAQGIPSSPPENTFVDTTAGSAQTGRYFYRVEVLEP